MRRKHNPHWFTLSNTDEQVTWGCTLFLSIRGSPPPPHTPSKIFGKGTRFISSGALLYNIGPVVSNALFCTFKFVKSVARAHVQCSYNNNTPRKQKNLKKHKETFRSWMSITLIVTVLQVCGYAQTETVCSWVVLCHSSERLGMRLDLGIW